MAAYSGFCEKTPLFAAFCFEYSELILHCVLYGIAQVLALALDERHDKTFDRKIPLDIMDCTDVTDNRVYFPQASETKCYGCGSRVICPSERLKYGESKECADEQVREVVNELVACPSPRSRKAELLTFLQTL